MKTAARLEQSMTPDKTLSSSEFESSSPPTVEAESNLSYSYWLGTFIIRGSVAPRVLLDVLGFGVLTVAIVLTIQKVEKLFLVQLSVPVSPFEAAGAVLGLLLVLRVNAGYSRWWEARVLWGGIVNQSQFIFLLLITLPVGLMQAFEAVPANPSSIMQDMNQVWIVSLYVMLLAYPLLSLDRIGMELQNPLSTQRIDFLPLDSICTSIERNVLELLHDIEEQPAAAPRPSDVSLPPDAEVSQQNDNLLADIS